MQLQLTILTLFIVLRAASRCGLYCATARRDYVMRSWAAGCLLGLFTWGWRQRRSMCSGRPGRTAQQNPSPAEFRHRRGPCSAALSWIDRQHCVIRSGENSESFTCRCSELSAQLVCRARRRTAVRCVVYYILWLTNACTCVAPIVIFDALLVCPQRHVCLYWLKIRVSCCVRPVLCVDKSWRSHHGHGDKTYYWPALP